MFAEAIRFFCAQRSVAVFALHELDKDHDGGGNLETQNDLQGEQVHRRLSVCVKQTAGEAPCSGQGHEWLWTNNSQESAQDEITRAKLIDAW